MQTRDIPRLNRALSCPIVASAVEFPPSARSVLYECWAALLYKYLPDPSVVDLLVDWEQTVNGSMYLPAEEQADEELPQDADPEPCDEIFLDSLSADEVAGFIASLEGVRWHITWQTHEASGQRVREDVGSERDRLHPAPRPKSLCGVWLDKEFERLTEWVRRLRVVEGNEREKHWPPLHVKTHQDLVVHSRKKPGVGWLNPGTGPAELRRFALAALAAHFSQALLRKTEENFVKDRAVHFLEAWTEVFDRGTFRLGLKHVQPMGVADGEDCKNMVYDFDPSSMQFHCFPVASFPPVREAFAEGQLDL